MASRTPDRPKQQTPASPQGSNVLGYNPVRWRRFWLVIGTLLLVNIVVTSIIESANQPPTVTIPYNVFIDQVDAGNVVNITATGDSITGTTTKAVSAGPGQSSAKNFSTERPSFASDDLEAALLKNKVSILAEPPNPPTPWWETLLLWFGPTLLIVFGLIYLMRRGAALAGGGAGGLLGRFGQSGARLYDPEHPDTTFADVAGIDEVKAELVEIVDFLKKPEKYQRLGGTIPKGVLLIGAPGTGKTLLARAVAGEAAVPFFSISASEFIEAIVGVGAARVRDLFQKARGAAPAIVFIDELDAVGRTRGAGYGGGHDEREQTLNQMLVEMDGFDTKDGVIILAATNRPDVLDPALLRPGRFDRQVVVDMPDIKEREAILRIHSNKVPLAPDVDFGRLSRATPGSSGADLANLVNEAALFAARTDKEAVSMADFEEARDKVLLGIARKSRVVSPEEKLATAFHEAGHALLHYYLKNSDPLHKVTVIPHGRALGLALSLPEKDTYSRRKGWLVDRIKIAMGGYVAEEIAYGETTTGTKNDIEQATEIARKMVCEWGMSDVFGPVAFGQEDEPIFLGKEIARHKDYSEETARKIDAEVHRILADCLSEARTILKEHRDQLSLLAETLVVRETLDDRDVRELLNLPPPNPVPMQIDKE